MGSSAMEWAMAVEKGLVRAQPKAAQEEIMTTPMPVIRSYPRVMNRGMTTGNSTRFSSHMPVKST